MTGTQAVHREEAAKELRDEAQKLIQRTQRSAEEATMKSDKSMKERVNENQHVTWIKRTIWQSWLINNYENMGTLYVS